MIQGRVYISATPLNIYGYVSKALRIGVDALLLNTFMLYELFNLCRWYLSGKNMVKDEFVETLHRGQGE